MGIYFRDILLIRISRGANNCGQHSLEKNSYFTMRFSPHFQLFYFNDRLEFCEFFEWKIKRINNADLFSQPPLLIFIKGANISGGHCIYIYIYIYICMKSSFAKTDKRHFKKKLADCRALFSTYSAIWTLNTFCQKSWYCPLSRHLEFTFYCRSRQAPLLFVNRSR